VSSSARTHRRVRADAHYLTQVTSNRTLQCVQVTDAPAAIVRLSARPSENVRVTTLNSRLVHAMRKIYDDEDVGQVRGIPNGGMQGVVVVVVFGVARAERRRRREEVARDLSANDE
jgi:hypothetical protein